MQFFDRFYEYYITYRPGEVLTTIEISSQYNPDGSKIKEALEQLVNGGKVDASLEISSSPDAFQWDKQGGYKCFSFRSQIVCMHIYVGLHDMIVLV